MVVGFEAKRFFKNYTGLGNYSRFIVNSLCENYPENRYYLFTPSFNSHPEIEDIIKKSNIEVVCPPDHYKGFTRSIWRTWGMSKNGSMPDLNVFHGLSHELPIGLPKHIKTVVTVHDLIFMRYPQFYNRVDRWIYKSKLSYACTHADKIVAVSQQTADDVVNYLGVSPSKIEVVYQGCHTNYKQKFSKDELEAMKRKHKLPAEYILNIGTVEQRKNLLSLVRAMAEMPAESRIPVVVIGRHTEYAKLVIAEAIKLRVIDHFHFMEIPFRDFPALYQAAKVFVYPSLFEGFGIPLIEAVESGTPVITSTGSCFAEAAGPGALYVDPLNHAELKDALLKVLSDDQVRERMVREGAEYVKQFSPSIISKNMMKVYNQL